MAGACRGGDDEGAGGRTRVVLAHQPLWGDPAPFRALLDRFAAAHPDLELATQTIPNDADVAHQLYLTALEGGSTAFDVLVIDVVWVAELARAGWIADLSDEFPPARVHAEFLPGPAEAVVVEGKTWALPWYVDVGLLYYRKDLLPRAPRTYDDLEHLVREATRRAPGLAGYVWQGRQYEGLTCNVAERIWGQGGELLDGERVTIDTPAARAALASLRRLVATGLSPAWVTAGAEEEARRAFQEGRAVAMRNWPYAWGEVQRPGSPVRGRVGVAPLPTATGAPGPGTLGGWQLAVNARLPPARRRAAARLLAHLTSPEAALALAVHYARIPARRDVYDDARLAAASPFLAALRADVARARPRPVTPYYNLIADLLQGELSAAVAGIRSPGEALRRAQRQIDRVMGAAP